MVDKLVHLGAASIEASASLDASTGDIALVAAVMRKDRKAAADFVARFADGVYAYIRSRLAPITITSTTWHRKYFLQFGEICHSIAATARCARG